MSSESVDKKYLEDTLPVWRKLYQVISESVNNVAMDIVEDSVNLCKKKLVVGLLEFVPYSPGSLEKWKKFVEGTSLAEDPLMCSFINKVSQELDLDAIVAWSIVCNFLIFEYYGKVDELTLIIRYETDMKFLIDHIWQFYSSDRMFLLKTLRFLLEKFDDKNYKYYKLVCNFFKDIDANLLWKNLLKTYKNLLLELRTDKIRAVSNDLLEQWIHRCDREKVEVLMLMIETVKYIKLDGNEFQDVIEIFLLHGFTRHPVWSGSVHKCRPEDLVDIRSAEMGCLLAIADRYRKELKKYILPQELEKSVEYFELQGTRPGHGCLLIWAILKQRLLQDATYFNEVIASLTAKKVFKSINDVLSNTIFNDCKPGRTVVEGAFGIIMDFLKIVDDYNSIFEEEGIIEMTCKFFKLPHLNALESLGPLFDRALEIFPFMLEPFLNMCLALMHSEDYFPKVLTRLRKIPTLCSGHYFESTDDSMTTKGVQQLFRGSDLFIIPPNTVTHRVDCYGGSYCKFELGFDFFLLVEQYIKSFVMITLDTNQICEKTLKYVTGSYEFLIELIKLYKGDLRNESDILSLMTRLDCIPGYFALGDFQSLSFFKLYFEAKCTMVMYNKVDFRDAFPLLMSKKVLPQITDFTNVKQECTSVHTNSACILFKYLKIEESTHDHSVLLIYINLIDHITEKNDYHKEVQIPGLWYLLNVVFPLHRQWTYDDPMQEVKVLKGCLKVFIKILQRYSPQQRPTKGSDLILFEMCCDAFMHDKWLVTGLWSILAKNRVQLQQLMRQESNWLRGPFVDNLECIQLELVLILLLFKHRARLPLDKWCCFDERSSSIAKSASVQLVNPFNSVIGILALKILNVLALNGNIPLLASLGLDHDQIQRLFLDRLREPMEDQEFKLNILELICTCIKYQHAMTAAFFNVHCSKKWYSDYKKKVLAGDTMEDFILDYLSNIKKSHKYLASPLQVAILKVIEKLWLCGKQHLIKHVSVMDKFWELLAKPISCSLDQSPEVYGHIFRILSIQLTIACKKPKGQETFLKTIEGFFLDKKQLFHVKDFILLCLCKLEHSKDRIESSKMCIRNFSELLMKSEKQKIVKKLPDEETRYLFVKLCLEAAEFAFANNDMFETWIDFCLVIFDSFGLQFKDKNKEVASYLIKLSSIFKMKYPLLNSRCRKGILRLIHKMSRDLQCYLEKNDSELVDFSEQIGPIFDFEYKMLLEQVLPKFVENHENRKNLLIPWMLFISITNTLLKYKNCDVCQVWFAYHNFLNCCTNSIMELVKHRDVLPLAKLIMYTLILYTRSPMAHDFFTINLRHFFDSIEPHITSLLTGQNERVYPLDLKEGWIWCTLLFQFNEYMITKFQKKGLELSFTFIRLNEKILDHVMFVIECTVDLRALDLIISVLKFFNAILNQWNVEWYRKANDSYNFIIQNVSKLINACIYIILRPKSIVLYFIDEYFRLIPLKQAPNGDKISDELMICIMNRLLAVLEWSFTCLYKINPNLLEMLDDFQYPEDTIELIACDFGVPRFELPVPYKLNYGRLLCLAHFLCKIMIQLNHVQQDKTILYTNEFAGCCALIEHSDQSAIPNQKLNSFLRYAMYEYSSMIGESWLSNVNINQIKLTTEKLMLFLSQQIYLYIKLPQSHSQQILFKRNMCSELLFLSEYVKQKSSELFNVGYRSSSLLVKGDMDVIKSYVMKLKTCNDLNDIIDKNFLLVVSHWIFNFCQIK